MGYHFKVAPICLLGSTGDVVLVWVLCGLTRFQFGFFLTKYICWNSSGYASMIVILGFFACSVVFIVF